MKYLKEATEIMEMYRESWMDDGDWHEFLYEISRDGYTISMIAKDLEKGVENGYKIEYQMQIVKDLLKVIFKHNGYT